MTSLQGRGALELDAHHIPPVRWIGNPSLDTLCEKSAPARPGTTRVPYPAPQAWGLIMGREACRAGSPNSACAASVREEARSPIRPSCEGIAVSTKYFTFSKPPVFSTKVTERFKISSDPIGKDGDATLNQFSPAGEIVSYTAQASELWITDGRSLTSAVEILEDAFQWWRKFIDEMSIS